MTDYEANRAAWAQHIAKCGPREVQRTVIAERGMWRVERVVVERGHRDNGGAFTGGPCRLTEVSWVVSDGESASRRVCRTRQRALNAFAMLAVAP